MEDLEAELIKRNREIAHARDATSKLEGRLTEMSMRNNDLLESVSKSDSIISTVTTKLEVVEAEVVVLKKTVEEKACDLALVKQEHEIQTEQLRKEVKEMEARAAGSEEASQVEENFKSKSAEFDEARAKLENELAQERKMHAATRAELEEASSSMRTSASRASVATSSLKDAEDRVQGLINENARLTSCLTELQTKASTPRDSEEISPKVQRDLDTLRLINKDLEEHNSEIHNELDTQRIELEKTRHELENLSSTKASLEAAKDAAESKLRELQVENNEFGKDSLQNIKAELIKQTRRADDAEGRYNAMREFTEGTDAQLEDAHERIDQLEKEMEELRQQKLQAGLEGAKAAADHEMQVKDKIHEVERQKVQIDMLQTSLQNEIKSKIAAEQQAEKGLEVSDALTNAKDKIRLLESQVVVGQEEKQKVERERDSLETNVTQLRKLKDSLSETLASEQDAAQKRVLELEARMDRERETHRRNLEETKRASAEETKQFVDRLAQNEAELMTKSQRCELLARNKADLLQELAEHSSKASTLESTIQIHRAESSRLNAELDETKQAKDKSEASLVSLTGLSQGKQEDRERMDMAAEEVSTRTVVYAMEKRRLNGALEESRRVVMNNLISSQQNVDGGKIAEMDKMLCEERKKSMEQSVLLSRLQRDNKRLEDANARIEEHRTKAVAEARKHESEAREQTRSCAKMTEDLRKASVKADTEKERADSLTSQLQLDKEESTREIMKLKGHNAELMSLAKGPPTARAMPAYGTYTPKIFMDGQS